MYSGHTQAKREERLEQRLDRRARRDGFRDHEQREQALEARSEALKEERRERKRAQAVADVDLETAEYRELQRAALLLGIQANQQPDDLVREIRRAQAELEEGR